VRSDFKPKDFSAAVDIRNANDRHGAYGLIFNLDDSWTSFYAFEIYSSGYFGVYRFDPDGYAVLAQAFSHAIKQDTATNRLSIERYGDVIKAYVNGQLLANIADGTYRRFGYVGLIVFSYDQKNVDIYFDNFNAVASDCIPNTTSSVSALFADSNQISTRHPGYPLR
jgi:hypothetical protein